MNVDLSKAIDVVIDKMIEDYKSFQTRDVKEEIKTKMFEEFKDSIRTEVGRKYVKIFANKSISMFVVATDNDPNFKLGDILKPAGLKAPTRNFARGNVFDTDLNIRWVGV